MLVVLIAGVRLWRDWARPVEQMGPGQPLATGRGRCPAVINYINAVSADYPIPSFVHCAECTDNTDVPPKPYFLVDPPNEHGLTNNRFVSVA